jgi:exodeoxyribonuclease VII small subunit
MCAESAGERYRVNEAPGEDNGLAGVGYEAARDELVDIVRKLETGGLPLEESLALWERGEVLARVCERHLAGARERIDRALATVEENVAGPESD